MSKNSKPHSFYERTPRPSKRGSKTDRLDCCQLAEFAAKGLLKPVAIPTKQEEADRQLQRLRDQFLIYLEHTEAELQDLSQQKRHHRAMKILRSHPGVGPVTAWAFRLEVFRPERFSQATEIASFLGLAPRISQSGQTTREGPITKTGRPQLRSKLIEASWIWIQHDARAREVYGRLCSNTGNSNKAIVAMARRLAIRLWKMLCDDQLYRQAG